MDSAHRASLRLREDDYGSERDRTISSVLIVGATGSIGRAAVAAAQEAGLTPRALVRDADRARRMLPIGTDLVVGATRRHSRSSPADRAGTAGRRSRPCHCLRRRRLRGRDPVLQRRGLPLRDLFANPPVVLIVGRPALRLRLLAAEVTCTPSCQVWGRRRRWALDGGPELRTRQWLGRIRRRWAGAGCRGLPVRRSRPR